MNIFNAITNVSDLLEKGKALKSSGFLTNTEAFAASLYGVLSALILLLKDFGYDITVQGSDLYTVANGWTATASIVYAIYRVITNPAAGLSKDG